MAFCTRHVFVSACQYHMAHTVSGWATHIPMHAAADVDGALLAAVPLSP